MLRNIVIMFLQEYRGQVPNSIMQSSEFWIQWFELNGDEWWFAMKNHPIYKKKHEWTQIYNFIWASLIGQTLELHISSCEIAECSARSGIGQLQSGWGQKHGNLMNLAPHRILKVDSRSQTELLVLSSCPHHQSWAERDESSPFACKLWPQRFSTVKDIVVSSLESLNLAHRQWLAKVDLNPVE